MTKYRSKDERVRLTISLSQDVVDRIDHFITNSDEVQNRSHAIELLVRKSVAPIIRTAVVLAGGYKNSAFPVPLTPIASGLDVIGILISYLKEAGVSHLIICAGPNEQAMRDQLGDGADYGLNIDYVPEDEPQGTGGALRQAVPLLPRDEPFLVIHGDVLTNLNFSDFVGFHARSKHLATIAVKPRVSKGKYGKVILQGTEITDFIGKSDESISIVNTGIYLFEPELLDLLPDGPSTLERDVFPELAGRNGLGAYFFRGVWFDISHEDVLEEAIDRWRKIQR
jgi:NDP-sugar pyrophosphorylase family protein